MEIERPENKEEHLPPDVRRSISTLKEYKIKAGDPYYRDMSDVSRVIASHIPPLVHANIYKRESNGSHDDLDSLVVSEEGGTGRGKNTLEDALSTLLEWHYNKALDEIADEERELLMFNERWEVLEDLQLHLGNILKDIREPFDNFDLSIVKRGLEIDIAESIRSGGITFISKPGATYVTVRGKVVLFFPEKNQIGTTLTPGEEVPVHIVEREFGSDTIYKLSSLKPPFQDINPNVVKYIAAVGVTADPFVLQVLTRKREILQLIGTDLKLANEVQELFLGRHVNNHMELLEMQEGGSLKQLRASQLAIEKSAHALTSNFLLLGRVPRYALMIIHEQWSVDDYENILSVSPDHIVDEAEDVATFLSESPTKREIAEIVRLMAYIEAESVIHQANLQIGDFRVDRPLSPLIGVVAHNSPDRSKMDKKQIRELFNFFGV